MPTPSPLLRHLLQCPRVKRVELTGADLGLLAEEADQALEQVRAEAGVVPMMVEEILDPAEDRNGGRIALLKLRLLAWIRNKGRQQGDQSFLGKMVKCQDFTECCIARRAPSSSSCH